MRTRQMGEYRREALRGLELLRSGVTAAGVPGVDCETPVAELVNPDGSSGGAVEVVGLGAGVASILRLPLGDPSVGVLLSRSGNTGRGD